MFILFLLFVGASAGCPYYETPGDCPNLVHTKITNCTNCLASCQALGIYDNTAAFFNGACYCLEDGICEYNNALSGTIIAQDSERVCCDGSALPEGACDCAGHVLDVCGECNGDGLSCVGNLGSQKALGSTLIGVSIVVNVLL